MACGGLSQSAALSVRGIEIRRCHSCGLGRSIVTQAVDLADYYDESYFQGGAADGYADYQGSAEALRMEFQHLIRQILPICRRGRLLEFGCAYGFLLDEAAPYFQTVRGVEYADAAARACRNRGFDVKTGAVSEEFLDGLYDTIIGLDVIEHVPEPHETLRLLSGHMPVDGVLVMTTGDWASPMARLLGSRWRLMTPPQHLWFFTPAAMTALLARVGLEVVSLTHPWKRVPISLAVYQLQRMLGMAPRQIPALNRFALPVNLWDAMRVVARKIR